MTTSITDLPSELLGLIGDNDPKILDPLSRLSKLFRRRVLPFLREVPITRQEIVSYIEKGPDIFAFLDESIDEFITKEGSEYRVVYLFTERSYPSMTLYYYCSEDLQSPFVENYSIDTSAKQLDIMSQYFIYKQRGHTDVKSREKVLTSFERRVLHYQKSAPKDLIERFSKVTRMHSYLTAQNNCIEGSKVIKNASFVSDRSGRILLTEIDERLERRLDKLEAMNDILIKKIQLKIQRL